MLESLLHFSIKNRWLVVISRRSSRPSASSSSKKLPIDAVPDITNNQVQINAVAPSLSPFEVEKQVTFPMENALAGIPGLQYTRSLSRNGFAQVTAVFEDGVDIYFARQQVGERLREASGSAAAGRRDDHGADRHGARRGVHVHRRVRAPARQGRVNDGKVGWQSDGSYLTPEGTRLTTEVELAAYLREVQDWIIRPQLKGVKDVAGVDAIGGYVKQYHVQPDPMKLVSYGLTFHGRDRGAGEEQRLHRRGVRRAQGRELPRPRHGPHPVHRGDRDHRRRHAQRRADLRARHRRPRRRRGRPRTRTGSASENGEDVVVGTAIMLIGANSRTVAAAVDAKMAEIQRSLPEGIKAKTVLNRTKLVDATIATVQKNLVEGAILVIVVLLLMLGNWRAALICALAIPLSMLMTATGMVQGKVSGNLMSLGAIDFGLIVDGAVIIVENCLRRLAEEQHHKGRLLTLQERLHDRLRRQQGDVRKPPRSARRSSSRSTSPSSPSRASRARCSTRWP
jgi:cobalt-zinc-cadmium resistance protein CzcA